MKLKIGFIGLGTMGAPIANNLRRAGHAMTVWNRTPNRAEHLVEKGARLAESPRECARGQDLVFTCLSDETALEAVLEGPDGILAGVDRGSLLVETSTAGTRSAKSLEARLKARGGQLLGAPLLGSRPAAEKAQLVVLAGGPEEARARAMPALHAIAARVIELESPVHAALMKLCVNAIGGAMITGFGEALALGLSGGLSAQQIIDTVEASGFHSPIFLIKGEQILNDDYEPRFAIALAEKDQRLAQEAAADQGAKMPINAAVRQLFAEAIESGRGQKDLAAVADLYFEWAKVQAKK